MLRAAVMCGGASLLALLTLGGCGGAAERAAGVERAEAAAAVVDALEVATAERDFDRICGRLFTQSLRRRTGGEDCPALLRRTTAGLREPRIEVESIDLGGHAATVRVTTTAQGQAPAAETIQLVRDKAGAFRIAGLSG